VQLEPRGCLTPRASFTVVDAHGNTALLPPGTQVELVVVQQADQPGGSAVQQLEWVVVRRVHLKVRASMTAGGCMAVGACGGKRVCLKGCALVAVGLQQGWEGRTHRCLPRCKGCKQGWGESKDGVQAS